MTKLTACFEEMEKKKVFLKTLLKPFGALYGVATSVRNTLFDAGLIKSSSFKIPIICVGNASVGGTGKTPHVEYIVSILKERYRVAVLSRGYKRKTRGFVVANPGSKVYDIGDEPMQIYTKFPDIIVACCEERSVGIRRIIRFRERPDVIILDDAFQHRHVKAGMNILLSDYNRPMYEDKMLPAGRLREHYRQALKRASHIIITKCPYPLTKMERSQITTHLQLRKDQQLYFSRILYGGPRKLDESHEDIDFEEWLVDIYKKGVSLLIVTGIATPEPFTSYIKRFFPDRTTELRFTDHHEFSERDIYQISLSFEEMEGEEKYIVTTEKDAERLAGMELPSWRERLLYIPIKIDFVYSKYSFAKEILSYVEKNRGERTTDSRLIEFDA